MAKINSNDILALIHTYLLDKGLDKIAQKLETSSGLDLQSLKTGIAKKKLRKICKFYLKNHPKLQKKTLEVAKNEESEAMECEEEENEQNGGNKKEPHSKSKTSKVAKVEETEEEEEEIVEEEQEEEKPEEKEKSSEEEPEKKTKIQKVKKQSSEEEEDDEEELKKAEKQTKIQKVEKQISEEDEEEENGISSLNENSKKISHHHKKNFFQRVDQSRLGNLKPELQDNTFMAKYKFGQGDEFGKIGHEKLKDTRGRNFKKEKSKLKNKNFQGGGFQIDIHARNSIKL